MHAFANPARFLRIARPATAWTIGLALPLILAGVLGGLFVTPPDYLQGDSVRILYIHVPSAWLGMAGWGGLAGASIAPLVRPSPLCVSPPGRSGVARPGARGGNGTGG